MENFIYKFQAICVNGYRQLVVDIYIRIVFVHQLQYAERFLE